MLYKFLEYFFKVSTLEGGCVRISLLFFVINVAGIRIFSREIRNDEVLAQVNSCGVDLTDGFVTR